MDLNSKYTIFQSFNYFEGASWPAFFSHVCTRLLCHQLQMSLIFNLQMCFDIQAGSQGSLCKNLHFWILVLRKTSNRLQFKSKWVQLFQAQGPKNIAPSTIFNLFVFFFFKPVSVAPGVSCVTLNSCPKNIQSTFYIANVRWYTSWDSRSIYPRTECPDCLAVILLVLGFFKFFA